MGSIRSVCFFAFLFFICKAEDSDNSKDLKSGQANAEEDESKSGAYAESFANSDGGYANGESYADASSGLSIAQSAASAGDYGSNLAQASAQSNIGSEQILNPYGMMDLNLLGFNLQASDSTKTKAEAVAQTNGISTLYESMLPSIIQNPLTSGPSQALAEAQSQTNNKPYYYPGLPSNYNSGSMSAQAESQAIVNSVRESHNNIHLGPSIQGNQYPFYPYGVVSPDSPQTEAQTLANSDMGYYNQGLGTQTSGRPLGLNVYPTGYPGNVKPPSSAQNSAEAQAAANAGGDGYIEGFNGYQLLPPNSGQPINQAEAQLLANANTHNSGFNPYVSSNGYPGYYKPSSLQAFAGAQASAYGAGEGYSSVFNPEYAPVVPVKSNAEAHAIANSGTNTYGLNMFQKNPQNLNDYGSNIAQGQAESYGNSGGVLYGQGQSSHASAKAEAIANSGVGAYYSEPNFYQPGYIPVNPGSSIKEAQGISNNEIIYQKKKPILDQHGFEYAQSQAEAMSASYGNAKGLSFAQGHNSQAFAEAQSTAGGHGSAKANAQALSGGANVVGTTVARPVEYSKLIPTNEYIMPYLLPGMGTAIVCKNMGEMYSMWSPVYECLVCACVTQGGVLAPICARCNGCKRDNWEPVTLPDQEPFVITPTPPTRKDITCSPLPSWQPFENPLNPCQICICKESLNSYGIMEAKIDCVKNPNCDSPPDAPVLPPIPDELPTPLPMCGKFPQNVIFPHPMDECKLCRCLTEMTHYGYLEPKITCVANPTCNVNPHSDQTTPKPIWPGPTEPVSLPDIIITTESVPWSPVTTLRPIGPGPLPGPSPHESCQPFHPGQAFQHPWDECQLCVCTEARDLGLITIEVNCFTKKSCCYEEEDEPVTQTAPAIYHTTPSIQILDKLCEFKSFGVEFAHPQDTCQLCVCEFFEGVVRPSCKLTQTSECMGPYISEGPTAIATAQANVISPLLPAQGFIHDTDAQKKYRYPAYSGYQPFGPYNMGVSETQIKEREKLIQSHAVTEPISDYMYHMKLDTNGFNGYQGNSIRPLSEHSAVLGNQFNSPNNQYKPILEYQNTGYAAAQAEASSSGFGGASYYPGYQGPNNILTSGTKSQNNLLSGNTKLYPGTTWNQGSYPNINGNSQSSYLGGDNFYEGIQASKTYPTLFLKPSYETVPVSYYPGKLGSEKTSAQAHSYANGLGSAAHSVASAGVIKTKSGEEELDN